MDFDSLKITSICGLVWGILVAAAAWVVLLVFGILAFIPAGPFHERNLVAGIVIMVLEFTLVTLAGGFVVGGALGAFLGLPLDVINNVCCDV